MMKIFDVDVPGGVCKFRIDFPFPVSGSQITVHSSQLTA